MTFFFFFPQWSYNKTLSFCSHSPFFKNRPVLSGREDTALRTTNAEWEILLRYQRGGKKTQQEFRRRCREQLNLDAGFLQPQQVPLVQFIFLPLYIKKKTLCSPWLECPVVEVPPKGRVNNIYLKRARAHVESGRLGWIKPVWNPCYCGSCWRGFFFFFPPASWCCGAVVVRACMWWYPCSQRNIFSFLVFLKENDILLVTFGGLF